MTFVHLEVRDGHATVRLERGKVNALNEQVVDELTGCFRELEADPVVRGILLTGTGKFFSFGFDIPEFLGVPKEEFARYLRQVHRPLPRALRPSTPGGGRAERPRGGRGLHARHRLRRPGDGEGERQDRPQRIGFGSSLFAGSLELLRFWVGERRAQELVYAGALHGPEQALSLGLVDACVAGADLMDEARKRLDELVVKSPRAFRSIKRLLRQPVLEEMQRREEASIQEFVEIWYSDETRAELEKIKSAPDASADAQSVSQNACRRSLKAGASSQNTA